MDYEIKRINIWSVVKIVFIISFISGAFIGILYTMLASIMSNVFMELSGDEFEYGQHFWDFLSPFFLILFFAIFWAIFNSVLSASAVVSYNAFAHLVGGVRVELNMLDKNGNDV